MPAHDRATNANAGKGLGGGCKRRKKEKEEEQKCATQGEEASVRKKKQWRGKGKGSKNAIKVHGILKLTRENLHCRFASLEVVGDVAVVLSSNVRVHEDVDVFVDELHVLVAKELLDLGIETDNGGG